MAFELMLLGALIFIFIVSFWGLLRKIKQTYERERMIAERIARRQAELRRHSCDSFEEVYTNPTFTGDDSIFPSAPPPYSRHTTEAPPKYDEVIKTHQSTSATPSNNEPPSPPRSSGPPPYTINMLRPEQRL